MAKYLLKVSYNAEGMKGVLKSGGTSRVAAVEQALKDIGGSLESFYFAFGADDVYAIADVPTPAAAIAMAATIGASGSFSSYETVVLIAPSEIDDAMKIAVNYRAPGA